MALLELAAAATGTGGIALHAREGALQNRHDLPRLAIAPDQSGHEPHGEVHVVKELLEAGAQIVETRLVIRG